MLLPVFAGAPDADALFRVACLVVLLSVVVHGGALIFMGAAVTPAPAPLPLAPLQALAGAAAAPVAAPTPAPAAAYLEFSDASDEIRIDEVKALLDVGAPVVLGDVRRDAVWHESKEMVAGAVRIEPQQPVDSARRLGLSPESWIVLYCTCPNEETSGRAARDLKRRGFSRARALVGGMDAWRDAGLPMAAKASS